MSPGATGGVFALRMAWRETRGAHRHFIYFLLCITVGVGALVAVQSFADSLTVAIARSAKSLLGADLEIRSTRPLSPDSATVVARLTREGATITPVRSAPRWQCTKTLFPPLPRTSASNWAT